ncbi:alpha-1,3-galactosyltransferase 2-like [Conger conger]|uniref:alpha-1,3-galactosyltransferase 2-like n=1 Tax=Conger conger TaxID=82655 RepID=UPI002A59B25C|nr:alpha-1,3-galactosyltransferase 2-like [Conger conger]
MNFISKVGTMRLLHRLGLGILCGLLLLFVFVRFSESPLRKYQLPPAAKPEPRDHVDTSLDLSSRTDVTTSTDWGAPILWDGMFDPDTYDKYHQKMGTSVALTVFAVGRYLEVYLMDLLSSAELHFMEGLPVTYYVFTNAPENVPGLQLKTGRALEIIKIKRHERWEDISMMRMKTLADAVQTRIRHGHRYVFCLDVDMVFAGRFGSEALGESVALQHSSFYNLPKVRYTYDRNPKSTACMETGDLYYHAAVFGGTWESVVNLTESCHRGIMTDKRKGVEALWHDESHLNKYFWLNKPSRVLSPEYGWNPLDRPSREIHVKRLLWAEKHYSSLRT